MLGSAAQGPAGTSSKGASSVGQKLPPAPNPTLASWPSLLKVLPGEVRDAAGEGWASRGAADPQTAMEGG